MEKLIITAAICGAEVTKAQNPAVPYTVEEMVREAKSAYEAGAAILHIHVREDDGTPTQDRERFRVVMDAIRKELLSDDGDVWQVTELGHRYLNVLLEGFMEP